MAEGISSIDIVKHQINPGQKAMCSMERVSVAKLMWW
jgi:hypothetical protein